MDNRASGERIQETISVLRRSVLALHQGFMAISKNNATVQKFYKLQVDPLIEQFQHYETLESIDVAFQALCGTSLRNPQVREVGSFEVAAEQAHLDVAIRQGYAHVLEFYRLYFVYCFTQYRFLLKKAESHAVAAFEMKEETALQSAALLQIQSDSAEKNLRSYQQILDQWNAKEFTSSLLLEVESLNCEIKSFNQDVHKVELQLSPISGTLLTDEENLAHSHGALEKMVRQQAYLEEKKARLIEEKNKILLEIEKRDKKYDHKLKSILAKVSFAEEDYLRIQDTPECKEVVARYEDEQRVLKSKKIFIESAFEEVLLMQAHLSKLKLSCEYKKTARKSSLLYKLSELLDKFFPHIEKMLLDYKASTLDGYYDKLKILIEDSFARYKKAVKNIKKICRLAIGKNLVEAVKPLQEAAVIAREKKRLHHVNALKSDDFIVLIDAAVLKLRHENIEQRMMQLNDAWQVMVAELVVSYREELEKILRVDALDEEQATQGKLSQLRALHDSVQDKLGLLSSEIFGAKLKTQRAQEILRLIHAEMNALISDISDALQRLEMNYAKHKIMMYQSRMFSIKAGESKSVFQKVTAIQTLNENMCEFLSEHKVDDPKVPPLLEDIQSYLSYENMRRAVLEEKVKSYSDRVRALRTNAYEVASERAESILAVKGEFDAWHEEEKKAIWRDCEPFGATRGDKYNYIINPANAFSSHLARSCRNIPTFSWWRAVLWTIFVPIVGYYIYSWWYERKCRLAMEKAARRKSAGHDDEEDSLFSSSDNQMKAGMSQKPQRRRQEAQGDPVFNEAAVHYHIYQHGYVASAINSIKVACGFRINQS